MSISDTDSLSKINKTVLVYLLISLFCVIFGAVYEMFSHGVYSAYMIYAFVYPLAGGALPFMLCGVLRGKGFFCGVAGNLYHSGIASLTVGSIVRGILEIYGTTNRLTRIYFLIGWILVIAGLGGGLIGFLKNVRKKRREGMEAQK